MRINNNIQKPSQNKNNISHKGSREIIRTLANPDALMSTILLETAVTGGRGYNAYKRGGKAELRERAFDDIVSAVFWMKGVDIFNKIGDKVGTHLLKLPTTEFDVGKDALRTPFANVVDDLSKTVTDPEKLKKLEKNLARFKFTKIILSTLMATGFVGFALPKINQAITRKMMHKEEPKQQTQTTPLNSNTNNIYEKLSSISFEQFTKNINSKEQNNPTFKGISPTAMTTIAHYLENNKICKLLSSDVGILSGRMVTARNVDEGIEYLFRDGASSFFYIASTPLLYGLFQKLSGSSKYTTIDPVAAKQLHEHCLQQLKNADNSFGNLNVNDFKNKLLGTIDDAGKAVIEQFAKEDVITLDKLSAYIKDESLLKKAKELSKLQPKQAGVSVLTKQQVADVFKNGSISNPDFMQKIFTEKFGKNLTNPYKFIPMKKITSFRDNIDDYVKSAIDLANKTNNGIVDKNILDKLNKTSFFKSSTFRLVALAISAFALGIAIPKIQYAITKLRTGETGAPGLREFEENNKEKKV